MFEHREAVPTPLGGGTIAYSLIRPRRMIYVTLGGLPDSLTAKLSNCWDMLIC